jgi:hypothetical protein
VAPADDWTMTVEVAPTPEGASGAAGLLADVDPETAGRVSPIADAIVGLPANRSNSAAVRSELPRLITSRHSQPGSGDLLTDRHPSIARLVWASMVLSP